MLHDDEIQELTLINSNAQRSLMYYHEIDQNTNSDHKHCKKCCSLSSCFNCFKYNGCCICSQHSFILLFIYCSVTFVFWSLFAIIVPVGKITNKLQFLKLDKDTFYHVITGVIVIFVISVLFNTFVINNLHKINIKSKQIVKRMCFRSQNDDEEQMAKNDGNESSSNQGDLFAGIDELPGSNNNIDGMCQDYKKNQEYFNSVSHEKRIVASIIVMIVGCMFLTSFGVWTRNNDSSKGESDNFDVINIPLIQIIISMICITCGFAIIVIEIPIIYCVVITGSYLFASENNSDSIMSISNGLMFSSNLAVKMSVFWMIPNVLQMISLFIGYLFIYTFENIDFLTHFLVVYLLIVLFISMNQLLKPNFEKIYNLESNLMFKMPQYPIVIHTPGGTAIDVMNTNVNNYNLNNINNLNSINIKPQHINTSTQTNTNTNTHTHTATNSRSTTNSTIHQEREYYFDNESNYDDSVAIDHNHNHQCGTGYSTNNQYKLHAKRRESFEYDPIHGRNGNHGNRHGNRSNHNNHQNNKLDLPSLTASNVAASLGHNNNNNGNKAKYTKALSVSSMGTDASVAKECTPNVGSVSHVNSVKFRSVSVNNNSNGNGDGKKSHGKSKIKMTSSDEISMSHHRSRNGIKLNIFSRKKQSYQSNRIRQDSQDIVNNNGTKNVKKGKKNKVKSNNQIFDDDQMIL